MFSGEQRAWGSELLVVSMPSDNSYGISDPFIVDLPIKHGGFPYSYVRLLEAIPYKDGQPASWSYLSTLPGMVQHGMATS